MGCAAFFVGLVGRADGLMLPPDLTRFIGAGLRASKLPQCGFHMLSRNRTRFIGAGLRASKLPQCGFHMLSRNRTRFIGADQCGLKLRCAKRTT